MSLLILHNLIYCPADHMQMDQFEPVIADTEGFKLGLNSYENPVLGARKKPA